MAKKAKTSAASSEQRTTSDITDFADKLWQAADTLRGSVDAAEYKHVVLGLIFLKYISDSFDTRREALRAELVKDEIPADQHDALLESRDEYTADRVFWVPPNRAGPTSRRRPSNRTSRS